MYEEPFTVFNVFHFNFSFIILSDYALSMQTMTVPQIVIIYYNIRFQYITYWQLISIPTKYIAYLILIMASHRGHQHK